MGVEEERWPMEKTLKLIELYKSRPFMWDRRHNLYHSRSKREMVMNEIEQILDTKKQEIERKWRNLLGQFSREVKRMEERARDDPEEMYETKWFYFNKLLFLEDRYKGRLIGFKIQETNDQSEEVQRRNGDVSPEENCVVVFEEDEDNLDFNFDNSVKEPQVEIHIDRSSHNVHQSPKVSGNKRKAEDVSKIVKTFFNGKKEKDEYDLFGEQVACKLRKFESERTRSNVQHVINTVLWEAGFGKYDLYHESFMQM